MVLSISMWLVSKTEGDYLVSGRLGQFLYINPRKKIIMVRLGNRKGVNLEAWNLHRPDNPNGLNYSDQSHFIV